MVRALSWISLRFIGATLHLKWHNLKNTKPSAAFFWKSQNWFQTVPKGQNIPLYELEELRECSSADMTQSGKHRIFYGIPLNFLEGSITTFYSSVNVPNDPNITLCQLEEHRSNTSSKMIQSGKHGILRGTFRDIFSKVLKLNPDCLKWSK